MLRHFMQYQVWIKCYYKFSVHTATSIHDQTLILTERIDISRHRHWEWVYGNTIQTGLCGYVSKTHHIVLDITVCTPYMVRMATLPEAWPNIWTEDIVD